MCKTEPLGNAYSCIDVVAELLVVAAFSALH
ncbi:hypothetical protein RCH21_003259 [Arthrobacter sp. PL16]|nr:hypothetical protein [Arthrobacter sp. PL16]